MSCKDPAIIVALDFPNAESALDLARRLDPAQCRVKVGLELFCAAGPDVVRALHDLGLSVFLDLKFHDIPNTVASACARAADMGVWMVNVHALGGPRMLAAARAAIPPGGPRLIGVTILTSHGPDDLAALGLGDGYARVRGLSLLCREAGLDGVVCSAHEAPGLQDLRAGGFMLVTPGIRPEGAPPDDQRRTRTISEALAAGADYLVVGRPVTRAPDPAQALAVCLAEAQAARRPEISDTEREYR
ncbi:orotidine-5'-phosphate decarboxylase [Acidiferrobacter sp.]|uniref:orotidine-5'-phosphate decarboxylase n=1 Tax=Acidiferrobacter sp. TaxID=1872107 RepID=UPI0026273E99|nr:orotidine-5'-phosphate decarboxylase [Acidiferrobacter sp.]